MTFSKYNDNLRLYDVYILYWFVPLKNLKNKILIHFKIKRAMDKNTYVAKFMDIFLTHLAFLVEFHSRPQSNADHSIGQTHDDEGNSQ